MSREASTHITIRALTTSDMVVYHALRLAGLEECPTAFGESAAHFRTVTPETLGERLRVEEARGGFILGAFSDERTLHGVVGLSRQAGEKMDHRAQVWGMYVSPAARGQGLGRRLLEDCLERAEAIEGLEQVHLAVVTSNQAAVGLYEALGFQMYGEDPNVLKVGPNRCDEYLMVRFLRRGSRPR